MVKKKKKFDYKQSLRFYDHKKIEAGWQKQWKESKTYKVSKKKGMKYYQLVELAYSSGDLHIGHWFGWTAPDVLARFKRMQGYNVLFPVGGFDSFGLPAENAAIKHGTHPRDWTNKNIAQMRKQFATMGPSFDWEAEVVTSDPDYYRWTQWLFLQLFKAGLAYRAKVSSNWCPKCKTVLANEHVVNGCCWRHTDTEVVQKKVKQWLVRITDYADRLIWPSDDRELKSEPASAKAAARQVDWPNSMRKGQNDWIGRSEGVTINFPVLGSDPLKKTRKGVLYSRGEDKTGSDPVKIKVFTTRPDTIFGATFMILAPEHPLALEITTTKQLQKVTKYVKNTRSRSQRKRLEDARNKTGVFTGAYAVNPLSKEKIPVWIADFVLMEYGTGAIMGVPGHDERDWDFAKERKLSIKKVIEPTREFQSIVLKRSVPDKFKEEVQKNKGWIQDYQDWGYKATMNPDYKDKYIEIVQRNLKGEKYYVDTDGAFRSVIFKNKLFLLPKQDKEARSYAKSLKVPDNQIDWQSKDDYHYCFPSMGILANSGKYSGLSSEKASKKIIKDLESRGLGKKDVQYHIRDWTISRRRYWGAPIPVIYCDTCAKKGKGWLTVQGRSFKGVPSKSQKGWDHAGWWPVPEEDLPVKLPYKVDYRPTGKAPLATAKDFVNVACPECGTDARRETETMDAYVDSSWYFFRYPDPKNSKAIFNKKIIKDWMPIQVYFGGPEHILGHTLYARFITKFLKDKGYINFDEFALKRWNHGIILGPDGYRMSKSRGNVVNPDSEVKKYGADAVRLYLCFMGPHEAGAPWGREGIEGASKFLQRVWRLITEQRDLVEVEKSDAEEILRAQHKTIQKVTKDIESLHFNTAVSAIMEYVNELRSKIPNDKLQTSNKTQKANSKTKTKESENRQLTTDNRIRCSEWDKALKVLVQLLAPFAPHMAEEIWVNVLGQKFSVHKSKWPEYSEEFIKEDMVTIAVQVNGKLRSTIKVRNQEAGSKNQVIKLAKKDEKVKKWIGGKRIRKEIFVPGKLVNFVV